MSAAPANSADCSTVSGGSRCATTHPTPAARSVSSQCWAGFEANTVSSTWARAPSLAFRAASSANRASAARSTSSARAAHSASHSPGDGCGQVDPLVRRPVEPVEGRVAQELGVGGLGRRPILVLGHVVGQRVRGRGQHGGEHLLGRARPVPDRRPSAMALAAVSAEIPSAWAYSVVPAPRQAQGVGPDLLHRQPRSLLDRRADVAHDESAAGTDGRRVGGPVSARPVDPVARRVEVDEVRVDRTQRVGVDALALRRPRRGTTAARCRARASACTMPAPRRWTGRRRWTPFPARISPRRPRGRAAAFAWARPPSARP